MTTRLTGAASGALRMPEFNIVSFAPQLLVTSGTWIHPKPGTAMDFLVVAIGGGGGGGKGPQHYFTSGGGGGSGRIVIDSLSLSDNVNYTIGAGGAAATTVNTSGSDGGTTTFDSLSAAGGSGGGLLHGGAGGFGGGGGAGTVPGNGGQGLDFQAGGSGVYTSNGFIQATNISRRCAPQQSAGCSPGSNLFGSSGAIPNDGVVSGGWPNGSSVAYDATNGTYVGTAAGGGMPNTLFSFLLHYGQGGQAACSYFSSAAYTDIAGSNGINGLVAVSRQQY